MSRSSYLRVGMALAVAVLLLGLTATTPADAAAPKKVSTYRTSWAKRYGNATLPSPASKRTLTHPRGAMAAQPALAGQNIVNTIYPNLATSTLNATPTIAVDPLTAGTAAPKIVNSVSVENKVSLTYTEDNFGHTYNDFGDLIGAISNNNGGTVDAEAAFQPNALWSSAPTCNYGFITATVYTSNTTTYANGITLYRVALTSNGLEGYSPTPVADYYNTAPTGSSVTMRVYDQPSLAYNPNIGGSNGTLYAFFVGSTWTATVGNDPTTYTGSDVLRSQSSDCGQTWSAPVAVSNTTNTGCTAQYSQHGSCDDVYYPSAVVTKTGNMWLSFLCQCAADNATTGRGVYAVFSGAGANPNMTLRRTFAVNNGFKDLATYGTNGGGTSLPGGQFYVGAQGNLAYNPNVNATTKGVPDGGLLLTYSHATSAGNPSSWRVVVRSLAVRSDGTIGSTDAANLAAQTLFPHIADRVLTGSTGGTPAVGYYKWNGSTVTYTVTRFAFDNTGNLSNPVTVNTGKAYNPGSYIGEYTGLDMNAVAPGSTSHIYGSFQGAGVEAGDPGDNYVWILTK